MMIEVEVGGGLRARKQGSASVLDEALWLRRLDALFEYFKFRSCTYPWLVLASAGGAVEAIEAIDASVESAGSCTVGLPPFLNCG